MFARRKPDLDTAEGRIDSASYSRSHVLVRAAAAVSWMCLGFASVGAIAATAIYLPLNRSQPAVASRPAPAAQARPADFATRWHEEWAQLGGRGRVEAVAHTPRHDSWLWTDATPSPFATRIVWGDARVPGMTIATPMPVPRPDVVERPVVASVAPIGAAPAPVPEQQLASLPTQPEKVEPGIIDRLFSDPDRAAKAVLTSNPNAALYDITKRVLYLPDGTKLEAHSGYGEFMDDPDSMHRKNVGVTPPNVYAVSFREKPFHGVRALRMKPIGDGKMYNRDGFLTHSFLLGEGGQSNGCISIREYDKFLKAYEDGQFNQIIVLRHIDEPVPRLLASVQ